MERIVVRRMIILCASALLVGAEAVKSPIVLAPPVWEDDPTYIYEVRQLSDADPAKEGPSITFNTPNPTVVHAENGRFPAIPIDVHVRGTDGAQVDRDSLKVVVKKGWVSSNITKEVRGFLEGEECSVNLCSSLRLQREVDLHSYGKGEYTFIVDIRDQRRKRAVGEFEVKLEKA